MRLEQAKVIHRTSGFLVGVGDDGKFYSRGMYREWYPFQPWNPVHQLKSLCSRLTQRVVWVDVIDSYETRGLPLPLGKGPA